MGSEIPKFKFHINGQNCASLQGHSYRSSDWPKYIVREFWTFWLFGRLHSARSKLENLSFSGGHYPPKIFSYAKRVSQAKTTTYVKGISCWQLKGIIRGTEEEGGWGSIPKLWIFFLSFKAKICRNNSCVFLFSSSDPILNLKYLPGGEFSTFSWFFRNRIWNAAKGDRGGLRSKTLFSWFLHIW